MLEKILNRLEADLEKAGFWKYDHSFIYSYNAINDLLESYQKEGWEFEFDIDFIEYLNPKQPNIVSFSLAWIEEGKLMTQVVLW